jgi:hypothetical protein
MVSRIAALANPTEADSRPRLHYAQGAARVAGTAPRPGGAES